MPARAWEQDRAAASGQAAVEVVERLVTVERAVTAPDRRLPRGREWADQLASVTRQVEPGRLYDRDLRAVAAARHAQRRPAPASGPARPAPRHY